MMITCFSRFMLSYQAHKVIRVNLYLICFQKPRNQGKIFECHGTKRVRNMFLEKMTLKYYKKFKMNLFRNKIIVKFDIHSNGFPISFTFTQKKIIARIIFGLIFAAYFHNCTYIRYLNNINLARNKQNDFFAIRYKLHFLQIFILNRKL